MNTSENIKQFTFNQGPRSASPRAQKDEIKNLDLLTALNQCLAHAIDLRSRAKQAYWSAKGGNFYMLHKMFNDFSSDLDGIADEFAARVMALGGVPVRTIAIVAKTSKLPPYPFDIVKASEHLDAVVASYEAASAHLPTVMNKAVASGDHATASVVTGFAKLLDEQVGFITAHIPAEYVSAAKKQSVG